MWNVLFQMSLYPSSVIRCCFSCAISLPFLTCEFVRFSGETFCWIKIPPSPPPPPPQYYKLIICSCYYEGKASTCLCIEDEKPYHCSAVYAAALHSISLPFRMEPLGPTADSCYVSGAVDIHGVVQILAGQARQNMVTILDVAMPAPSLTGNI
jgi:hypothetical protein